MDYVNSNNETKVRQFAATIGLIHKSSVGLQRPGRIAHHPYRPLSGCCRALTFTICNIDASLKRVCERGHEWWCAYTYKKRRVRLVRDLNNDMVEREREKGLLTSSRNLLDNNLWGAPGLAPTLASADVGSMDASLEIEVEKIWLAQIHHPSRPPPKVLHSSLPP